MVQALIVVNKPSYTPERWQATLLIFASIINIAGFNIFAASHLPLAEGLFATFYVFVFFPVIIVSSLGTVNGIMADSEDTVGPRAQTICRRSLHALHGQRRRLAEHWIGSLGRSSVNDVRRHWIRFRRPYGGGNRRFAGERYCSD